MAIFETHSLVHFKETKNRESDEGLGKDLESRTFEERKINRLGCNKGEFTKYSNDRILVWFF